MPFVEDINKRINQTLAQAGLPIILHEDTEEINQLADGMDKVTGRRESKVEPHPSIQAVAMEMRQFLSRVDGIEYDTRWCPEFDESKPETMSRYYALLYGSNTLVPLSSIEQWTYVAEDEWSEQECDAHISSLCYRQRDKGNVVPLNHMPVPVMLVAVVRGEIICVFKLCAICYDSLGHFGPGGASAENASLYSGPYLWYDSPAERSINYDNPWD